MQTAKKPVKLSPKGRIICPNCNRATAQEVRPDTQAANLKVWCRGCKQSFLVNIDSGQCSLSSPC